MSNFIRMCIAAAAVLRYTGKNKIKTEEYEMRKTQKILALLLTCALLLPACAQDGGETGETTAAAVDTAAPVETTTADPNDRSQVKDNVPEDLKFNGETVRVVSRDAPNVNLYDTVGTDNLGDYVTDGVWNRSRLVEERLGVTMENTMFSGSLSEVQTQFKALVLSGSDEFDYLHTTGNTTAGLNVYLRDLADLPYVNYDEPWWWKDANDSISLDGKTYNYIFSDMLLFCYIQTGVVYYNKTLYENAFGDPDEMYQTVMDGKWTIDKMMELTASAYSDANGDGVPNAGDIFGSIKTKTQNEETPHFLQGFDLHLYSRGDNGSLIIDFDEERCISAIEKMGQYNVNTTGVMHSDLDINQSYKYFVENSSLFFPSRMARVVADFREMEEPYGILPYPKLDEAQKDYISLIHSSSTNLCVPKTVSDERVRLVGAWFECCSAESWRSVMPEFLELALKVKYSRDSMSGQVIDLVIAGVTKNILFEYGTYSNNIFNTALAENAKKATHNFASAYKKLAPAAQKSWDKAVADLQG